LLGLALRVPTAASQSYWYDEIATFFAFDGKYGNLLHRIQTQEGSPPLYFMVARAWRATFGPTELGVRSLSILAGVLVIPCVYAAVLWISDSRRAARVAAVLVATNPFLVWYSQEMRPYSLAVFLCAAGFAAVVRWATTASPARGTALAGGVLFGAALGTHYFTAFFVVGILAWLTAAHRRRAGFTLVVAPIAVAGALLAPFAFAQRNSGLQAWIAGWPVRFRASELARHLVVGPSEPNGWIWWVPWIVIGLVVVAAGMSWRRRTLPTLVPWLGLTAAVQIGVPLLLAAFGMDYFLDRNLIFVLLPIIVIVAVVVGQMPRHAAFGLSLVGVVALIGVWSIVFTATTANAQRADWRELAALIDTGAGPRAVVFNTGNVQAGALTHYLHRSRPVSPKTRLRAREIDFVGVRATSGRCSFWFGRACSLVYLDPHPPTAIAAKFPHHTREARGQFVIVRMRAPRPVTVQARDLVDPPDPASLVIAQRPR
jgi:Predicted membrane protein